MISAASSFKVVRLTMQVTVQMHVRELAVILYEFLQEERKRNKHWMPVRCSVKCILTSKKNDVKDYIYISIK